MEAALEDPCKPLQPPDLPHVLSDHPAQHHEDTSPGQPAAAAGREAAGLESSMGMGLEQETYRSGEAGELWALQQQV